ncbi:hypothetical protein LOY46_04210 [Pseudomonas sichuanensis]|uniref:hypothetical protein n=1 Tax=Pseudomonas sichuanensis TaxID=2213015 RepID=UPI00215F44FD|nr:hypothetical protein [Pseudomonas sichuanensis]UVK83915.1 hypothetical protein LOY46_04210 [Pseudomonas sichuanensis]
METAPTSEELLELFKRGELASQMARRFGLGGRSGTSAIEERCIALHNARTIDLLELVEGNALQRLNGTDFFLASHFFCQLLPELEAEPGRMMACVDALVTRGGDDGAANQPNGAFQKWCANVPQRASEVIAAAHQGDDLSSHHLSFALTAISDLAEARRIAVGYEDIRRQAAIAALGRIEHPNLASHSETFSVFKALLEVGIDDPVRASVLHATMEILARSPDIAPADANSLISQLVMNPGKFTIHQCARALWACREALTPDIVSCLLGALISLESTNKGTVEELDVGLQVLMEHGHTEAALSFVTRLLSRRDDDLELETLDSFTRTLLSGSPDVLSQVVVRWLKLGAPRLCAGLAKAIKGPGLDGTPLSLKAEDLAISPTEQLFICRKAVGWFFFKPTTASSVLISVLRVCDKDTSRKVRELLVDPLLQNYGGVRKYLDGLAPEDAASKAVTWALAQNDSYLEAQRPIPLIVELQPSEHHRRIERLRISDQMRDAHKKAESGSVFSSLVSRSVLLYGNRSLTFVDDGQDNLRPMEIDLHSHGVSYEIPRMEVIDPVGLEYVLRLFRHERIEE